MSKPRKVFSCSACGADFAQWMGRCPRCGEWNTLEEDRAPSARVHTGIRPEREAPVPITAIATAGLARCECGLPEVDRVLGGGVVPGSLVLIGGDPGVGKSTLMLQVSQSLAARGQRILYVSGEESPTQLKLRGERLGVKSDNILVYSEVTIESIRRQIGLIRPDLVIIDSIQAVFSAVQDSPPGSMSQIRHTAGVCMEIAKGEGVTIFVIGHVTKDGWIAGPKMLEHMVDTVLYFEGEHSGAFRILRAVKNRFGPTGEIGVFEMQDTGLREVQDPSSIFVHGLGGDVPGSAVMATLEGSRAIVAEVQSLVSSTAFSQPRRIAMGIDTSRLNVLLAVLEKRAGVFLSASDVVVNVAGGMKVIEPACDLAVAMAVASGTLDRVVPRGTVCIGEIGLAGELRPVGNMEARLREASRMGFTQAVIPKAGSESLAPPRRDFTLRPFVLIGNALSVLA